MFRVLSNMTGRPSAATEPQPRRSVIRGRKRLFREPPPEPEQRVNERIRITPVRVIDADGSQVGVIPTREALEFAKSQGLDLVEVAPNARPVVCKIMDHGRFVFERDKKAKEAKKHQHRVELKEVKLRPNIGDHDFSTKVGMAERFLRKGCHVKLTVMFRMREMRRPENGYEILKRAVDELSELATVESPPPEQLAGRDLSMVLKPAS
jgi:translation initiation factor IF-3